MRRHAMGIIGLALTGIGLVLWSAGHGASGPLTKAGIVLIVAWLAWPAVERIPPWMYGSTLVGLLIVLIRPKAVLIVVPALLLMWLLMPRSRVNQNRGNQHKHTGKSPAPQTSRHDTVPAQTSADPPESA